MRQILCTDLRGVNRPVGGTPAAFGAPGRYRRYKPPISGLTRGSGMSVLVVVLAVTGACCLGCGFVLQQDAASHAPRSDYLSPRLLLDLMRVPSWLAGIGLMVCGMVLGALALGKGEVSVVEPLLATNLLFAMTLSRHRTGQRLGRQGWSGLWLLAGGVTAFLVAGRPRGGEAVTDPLRHWLVVGAVVGSALLLTVVAKRHRSGVAPALLAVAAGLLYGLQDALTRLTGRRVTEDGLVAALSAWQPYGVVVLGVTGLLLVQSAFETGPLRVSLPPLTAAQPLAGIACGIGFLGDRVRTDAVALAWQASGLAAVVVGIALLGLHPAMPEGRAGRHRHESLQPN